MVRYFVALMIGVTVLAGCGASSGDNVVDSIEYSETVTPAGSPLEGSLGFPSDPGRRQYQLLLMQREADASMVNCMRQAGFFYAVRPAEQVFRSGAFVGDGSREWTSVNGFGITSSFSTALAADAAGSSSNAATTNLGYVGSLTAAESADYDLALVGDVVPDPATAAYEPAGCWGEAYTDMLRLLAIIDEFETKLVTLNSRLNADPRAVSFQTTWSMCMLEAGHSYADQTALVDDIYARLLDIELAENGGVTQVVSREALDELADFERQAAIASFDCEAGFADDLVRLRLDYEREFLDDNRFRIAELQPPTP